MIHRWTSTFVFKKKSKKCKFLGLELFLCSVRGKEEQIRSLAFLLTKCWGAWKSRPPSREEMYRKVTQHLFWSRDKHSWNLLFRAFFLACYAGHLFSWWWASWLGSCQSLVKVLKSRGSPVRALLTLCKLRFSKDPITFRARNQIFKSKYKGQERGSWLATTPFCFINW